MSKYLLCLLLCLAGSSAYARTPDAKPAATVGRSQPETIAQSKSRSIAFLSNEIKIMQGIIDCIRTAATPEEMHGCHAKAIPLRQAEYERYGAPPFVESVPAKSSAKPVRKPR